MGNEGGNLTRPPDYGVNAYQAMAAVAHRVHPTRPVTQALRGPLRWNGTHQQDDPKWLELPPHQLELCEDVPSSNYYGHQYFGQDRVKYPQLFTYICSEAGEWGWADFARLAWRDLEREHAVGLFYWGGIDYQGESRAWPDKGFTGYPEAAPGSGPSSGFVDAAGFRRPASYAVQSCFSDRPMVYLHVFPDAKVAHEQVGWPSCWNFAAGQKLKVEVFTNAQEVEVWLNGQSLGVKKREGEPGEHRLMWDVPFAPGTLRAVARNGGKEVARYEVKTAGEPKALRLTSDVPKVRADGQDLTFVTAQVVDADGMVVPTAAQLITFAVSGAGTDSGSGTRPRAHPADGGGRRGAGHRRHSAS